MKLFTQLLFTNQFYLVFNFLNLIPVKTFLVYNGKSAF